MEDDVHSLADRRRHSFKVNCRFKAIAVALTTVLAFTHFTGQIAQAQQFHTLYNFTGGNDGGSPNAGVTVAASGLLYGTAPFGGPVGNGAVFSLKSHGSGWTLDPLYGFTGQADGKSPLAGVAIGPSGALYGTTWSGGSDNGGTVFELQPFPTFCRTVLCDWNETFLHRFQGVEGAAPLTGNVIFDQAGNLYGTTSQGGEGGGGTVYELTQSGTVNALYNFTSNPPTGGYHPYSGVIFGPAGNLYGTTFYGGNNGCMNGDGCGTVFQLTPSGGGTWTESVIYTFTDASGANPTGTLVQDSSGTTNGGGTNNAGVVFMLSYSGGWVFTPVYNFTACNPFAGVTVDAAGDLYGVCSIGGAFNKGFVFKLTNSNGTWSLTDLYDFTGGNDGYDPLGSVAFDSSGNLFGTTSSGGNRGCDFGCGTVWEITGLMDRR